MRNGIQNSMRRQRVAISDNMIMRANFGVFAAVGSDIHERCDIHSRQFSVVCPSRIQNLVRHVDAARPSWSAEAPSISPMRGSAWCLCLQKPTPSQAGSGLCETFRWPLRCLLSDLVEDIMQDGPNLLIPTFFFLLVTLIASS